MRDKLVIKNTSIILFCQIVEILSGFIIRKIFIDKIGIDMLGVNGTFASLLSTLSLAELGFESAIIYSLYKPIQKDDQKTIKDILYILKLVYISVGFFILIIGFALSYFLPALLKGVEVNWVIYIAFYLNLIGSAVTYFLAYKRTYLLAMQRDYIRNVISLICKLVAVILQILFIYLTASYLIYSFISIIQNISTNVGISLYVDKNYPQDLKDTRFNKNLFRGIFSNVKDIFFGKIAGYIYSSTDNLILSAFISTQSVGLLGNYTQILYQMRTILNNTLNSTKPIIGHFLTQESNKQHSFEILQNYTFIRFIISTILFVPGFVLCNLFIRIWLGQTYVLSRWISLFLVLDIFITCTHGALVDYIQGLGYFKQDRNISIIGATLNILLSLYLVYYLGIIGVLVGTVVSQSFFWITRSIIVFKDYFDFKNHDFRKYWLFCISYISYFFISCFLGLEIYNLIIINNDILRFIAVGFILVLLISASLFILYFKTSQFKYVFAMIKNSLKSLINK